LSEEALAKRSKTGIFFARQMRGTFAGFRQLSPPPASWRRKRSEHSAGHHQEQYTPPPNTNQDLQQLSFAISAFRMDLGIRKLRRGMKNTAPHRKKCEGWTGHRRMADHLCYLEKSHDHQKMAFYGGEVFGERVPPVPRAPVGSSP